MVMRYFSRDTDIITKRRYLVRYTHFFGLRVTKLSDGMKDVLYMIWSCGLQEEYTDNKFADHGGTYTT